MTLAVLLFGLALLIGTIFHIKKESISEIESKHFIVVSIIVATMYLVAAHASESLMAPVMGLFGTIIGFLMRGSTPAAPVVPPVVPNDPPPVPQKTTLLSKTNEEKKP